MSFVQDPSSFAMFQLLLPIFSSALRKTDPYTMSFVRSRFLSTYSDLFLGGDEFLVNKSFRLHTPSIHEKLCDVAIDHHSLFVFCGSLLAIFYFKKYNIY